MQLCSPNFVSKSLEHCPGRRFVALDFILGILLLTIATHAQYHYLSWYGVQRTTTNRAIEKTSFTSKDRLTISYALTKFILTNLSCKEQFHTYSLSVVSQSSLVTRPSVRSGSQTILAEEVKDMLGHFLGVAFHEEMSSI